MTRSLLRSNLTRAICEGLQASCESLALKTFISLQSAVKIPRHSFAFDIGARINFSRNKTLTSISLAFAQAAFPLNGRNSNERTRRMLQLS
jgi:hypothetical protein